MIAADTSSLIAYFTGESGKDVERLASALAAGSLVLPPVVITEILTDPRGGTVIESQVVKLAVLDIREGYWVRAGQTRRVLYAHRLKAKVADALIAQACIDHDVPLITRDGDFRHFARHCGLKLA